MTSVARPPSPVPRPRSFARSPVVRPPSPVVFMPKNFAIIGVAGYIAPRHLKAIRDTGNHLVAAIDPHDSVGILDQYSFDVRFFSEIERFDRHLEKLRRGPDETRVHYVSICSPNYLLDAHCRLALRIGANAICE
jgi:UDP-N-acetyl-2-amino-2-deoxyglucuronate dehydrogenase